MKKTNNVNLEAFRLDSETLKLLNIVKKNYKRKSKSEIFRMALREFLNKDILEKELFSVNLGRLVQKTTQLEDNIKLLMDFMSMFVRIWYSHTPELPDDKKADAWKRAEVRFNKMCNTFNIMREENITLLADLLINMNTPVSEKSPAD